MATRKGTTKKTATKKKVAKAQPQGPNVDELKFHIESAWERRTMLTPEEIEWATRPYYQPRQAVYEARLMEGLLINALDRAGRSFQEPLSLWHGNLLFPAEIGPAAIPGS